MKTYQEIKEEQAVMVECFFAFSNEQMKEGREKMGLVDIKIYSAGMGLYGTREGIKNFMGFYDQQSKRIGEECDPQKVYDYESDNHECSYTCDDHEAIELVVSYFGKERAKTVKRKYACIDIDSIKE